MKRTVKQRVVRPELILVCRANRARSPVAVELFKQYAAERNLGREPVITSSGLYAVRGQPLLTSMQDALQRKKRAGIEHRSRLFSLPDASAARIVITFEREFTRAVVTQDPALVPRTFTLREIVRLTRSNRWDPAWNGRPDVAAKLHAIRPLVEPGDDDTPDPISGRRRIARRVLDSLVSDVAIVAPVVFGPGKPQSAEPEPP